jgi:hypothetical protein
MPLSLSMGESRIKSGDYRQSMVNEWSMASPIRLDRSAAHSSQSVTQSP